MDCRIVGPILHAQQLGFFVIRPPTARGFEMVNIFRGQHTLLWIGQLRNTQFNAQNRLRRAGVEDCAGKYRFTWRALDHIAIERGDGRIGGVG